MRLTVDVAVPAEAHEDRDPEGFTAGLMLGVLRGAGMSVRIVEGGRHTQGSPHDVDTCVSDVPDVDPAPAPLVPDVPPPDPDDVPDHPPHRPAREAREARLRAAAADAIGY